MKKPKKQKIPVNVNKLSDKSKRSWTLPEFYEDEAYNCVDCGAQCVFTAEQQQKWYEGSKRYFWQRPIRCDEHHKIWAVSKKKKLKMDHLISELNGSNSKKMMLECAESIVEFYEQTGHGNLGMAKHLLKNLKDYKSSSHLIDDLRKRIDKLLK